jgi:hypothetical protein
MGTTNIILDLVLIIMILGAVIGPVLASRRHSKEIQNKSGPEYDRMLLATGAEPKAKQ